MWRLPLSLVASVAVLAAPPPARADDLGRICVVRAAKFVGSAVPYLVRAQGRPVALVRNNRRFCIDAEPGRYELTVQGNFANVATAIGTSGTAVVVGAGTSGLGDSISVQVDAGSTSYLQAELAAGMLLWRKLDAAAWAGSPAREVPPADRRMDQWDHAWLVVNPAGVAAGGDPAAVATEPADATTAAAGPQPAP